MNSLLRRVVRLEPRRGKHPDWVRQLSDEELADRIEEVRRDLVRFGEPNVSAEAMVAGWRQ